MTAPEPKDQDPARLPPRWFIRGAWRVHRAIVRMTGRRRGLWRPEDGRRGWGALRLTTTGRRTGQSRAVIVGYLVDGENVVTLAMNGWQPEEPAWWLNLQADPRATIQTKGGDEVPVTARAAEGEERERIWSRFREADPGLDGFAARRPGPTAVVVLTPAAPA
jgi:deazaflavin-dependent oxidoreductase (nitroreductase family)